MCTNILTSIFSLIQTFKCMINLHLELLFQSNLARPIIFYNIFSHLLILFEDASNLLDSLTFLPTEAS